MDTTTKKYYEEHKITKEAILDELEDWVERYSEDMSTVKGSMLLDHIISMIANNLIPGLETGLKLSHSDEYLIYQKLDENYKLENMETILQDSYNLSEEQIENLNPDFVEIVMNYNRKGEENDDSWRYIMDAAIDSALDLAKVKGINQFITKEK